MLSAWLADNPYEKPEPIEGEPAPALGELTPSQMEALRQHVSKLLTVVQIAPRLSPKGLRSGLGLRLLPHESSPLGVLPHRLPRITPLPNWKP